MVCSCSDLLVTHGSLWLYPSGKHDPGKLFDRGEGSPGGKGRGYTCGWPSTHVHTGHRGDFHPGGGEGPALEVDLLYGILDVGDAVVRQHEEQVDAIRYDDSVDAVAAVTESRHVDHTTSLQHRAAVINALDLDLGRNGFLSEMRHMLRRECAENSALDETLHLPTTK